MAESAPVCRSAGTSIIKTTDDDGEPLADTTWGKLKTEVREAGLDLPADAA